MRAWELLVPGGVLQSVGGKLVVDVGRRSSWRQFDDGAQALIERRVTGKAVIDLD